MKMKKAAVGVILTALVMFCGVSDSEAAEIESRSWTVVQATYEVQEGDTLDSVAFAYMSKNDYGPRNIKEFKEGLYELNPWLLKRDIHVGDKIRINYWKKVQN